MFNSFFSRAVDLISQRHSFNEKTTLALGSLRGVVSPNGFESFVVEVDKVLPQGLVAGVDSGFVSKKLSFIDLVLVKTVGVCFEYSFGKLINSNYFPAPFAFPKPLLLRSGLDVDEESQSVSLIRLEEEIGCAIQMIKKFKPRFLFIDGSIVPQYQDKPRKDSNVNEDYVSIVHSFQNLYRVAEENSTRLVACVEDSRGTRFRQILSEEVLPKTSIQINSELLVGSFDVAILDYYLRVGERTFVFPYTSSIENHAILKDFVGEWAKSIFVFYIKSTELDKPLRVEFVCKNIGDLEVCTREVASIVFALSSLHKEYSFPSVLIEADLRAGLNEQEISIVYDRLVDKLGSKIRMRRGNRPFG